MIRSLILICLSLSVYADLSAIYLSWYGDPTTTMAIQWHTSIEDEAEDVFLQLPGGSWQQIEGTSNPLGPIFVHQVLLEELIPNTEYFFRVGDSPVYKFRTAPAILQRAFEFVIGGDAFLNVKLFRRMCQTIVENNPLFAVIGGDIAYAIHVHPFEAQSKSLRRWLFFLNEWKERMTTPDGRMIPFLLAPGNHDLSPDQADLFFGLFAFPEKQLYRALDFGNYLSLILLDTGHFDPIEGKQTLWLDQALASRTDVPYCLAVYHEAAYPSFYSYQGSTPQKIRANWCPLFEKYRLQAAFENHNHAYKRTFPIKENQIDSQGVTYLGDGSWGVPTRSVKDAWYIEKGARKNSVFLIQINSQKMNIQAVDLFNQVFDETPFFPRQEKQ